MVKGRRQNGNKKNSTHKLKNNVTGVGLKRNDSTTAIDKVMTVAKPDCYKSVQAKAMTKGVNAKRVTIRIGNIDSAEISKVQLNDIVKEMPSYLPGGDGTDIVDFVTNGDGTGIVNFKTGKVKAEIADLYKGDGTDVTDFLINKDI